MVTNARKTDAQRLGNGKKAFNVKQVEKMVEDAGGSYTAGKGITIADETISVDTTAIQEKLTAGTGITIVDKVISATGGGSSGGGFVKVPQEEWINLFKIDISDKTYYTTKYPMIFALTTGAIPNGNHTMFVMYDAGLMFDSTAKICVGQEFQISASAATPQARASIWKCTIPVLLSYNIKVTEDYLVNRVSESQAPVAIGTGPTMSIKSDNLSIFALNYSSP